MQRWKKFENDTFSYLQDQAITLPLVVHRFYDTRSAGDYLPSQPGDFMLLLGGVVILLELKSSEEHNSLRSCFSSAVPSTQIAHHRLWHRAGSQNWFLFWGADGRYERWPLYPVQVARETGTPLKNGRQRTFSNLKDILESVIEDYLLP